MGHWARGQAAPPSWSCVYREESALNPGQGPPGLGDHSSLFLEGQDQQHGEDKCPLMAGQVGVQLPGFCWAEAVRQL